MILCLSNKECLPCIVYHSGMLDKRLKLIAKQIFRLLYSLPRKSRDLWAETFMKRLELPTFQITLKNSNLRLAELCDKYGSDKGSLHAKSELYFWKPHGYTDFYELLFHKLRDKKLMLFECGLGSIDPEIPSNMGVNGKPGGSLRVWRDYFHNSSIYGADVDPKTLFTEDRIQTVEMDQTNAESISDAMKFLGVETFDVIIDDGLHNYLAGTNLFENLYNYLPEDGIYVIEDVHSTDKERYLSFFSAYTDLEIAFVDFGRRRDRGSLIYIHKKESIRSII